MAPILFTLYFSVMLGCIFNDNNGSVQFEFRTVLYCWSLQSPKIQNQNSYLDQNHPGVLLHWWCSTYRIISSRSSGTPTISPSLLSLFLFPHFSPPYSPIRFIILFSFSPTFFLLSLWNFRNVTLFLNFFKLLYFFLSLSIVFLPSSLYLCFYLILLIITIIIFLLFNNISVLRIYQEQMKLIFFYATNCWKLFLLFYRMLRLAHNVKVYQTESGWIEPHEHGILTAMECLRLSFNIGPKKDSSEMAVIEGWRRLSTPRLLGVSGFQHATTWWWQVAD